MFRRPTSPCVTVYAVLIFLFFRWTRVRRVFFCLFPFSMNEQCIETEYVILQNIYTAALENHPLRQRDFARIARTSLGMTNSILKRLVKKGWITVKKLNSRNIEYAVTAEGFNEILHRGYRYFKRTIKNVAFYRDSIDQAIRSAAGNKLSGVALVGNSDLEFIVEHISREAGLTFYKFDYTGQNNIDAHTLTVFAEDIPVSDEPLVANRLFLSQLVLKTPSVPLP